MDFHYSMVDFFEYFIAGLGGVGWKVLAYLNIFQPRERSRELVGFPVPNSLEANGNRST